MLYSDIGVFPLDGQGSNVVFFYSMDFSFVKSFIISILSGMLTTGSSKRTRNVLSPSISCSKGAFWSEAGP